MRRSGSVALMAFAMVGALIVAACVNQTPTQARFENMTWVLESYGQYGSLQDVLKDSQITAVFDGSKDQVTGSAGCNRYFAGYEITGNNIAVSEAGSTEKYCVEPEDVMDMEQVYLRSLQNAEKFEIKDGKFRVLYSNEGLLIFGRSTNISRNISTPNSASEASLETIVSAPVNKILSNELELPSYAVAQYVNTNQQIGIWVTGRGEITLEPNLAVLSAGVEAKFITVSEANRQAAQAMNQIVKVLKKRGIQDRDIQTHSFSIFPDYQWNDKQRKQELVGYRVNNQVSVRIRDLANIGTIIDEVAKAGGDLTRIQDISFTIEDTSVLEPQVREMAVAHAIDKANQFAQLTGVQVGDILFIIETSGDVPRVENIIGKMAFAEVAFDAPTPISGGELTISMTVQAVFGILP